MGLLCVLWEETLAEMEQGHRSDRGVGSALTTASPASTGCGVRWCPESLSSGKGGARACDTWVQGAGLRLVGRPYPGAARLRLGDHPPGLGWVPLGKFPPSPPFSLPPLSYIGDCEISVELQKIQAGVNGIQVGGAWWNCPPFIAPLHQSLSLGWESGQGEAGSCWNRLKGGDDPRPQGHTAKKWWLGLTNLLSYTPPERLCPGKGEILFME